MIEKDVSRLDIKFERRVPNPRLERWHKFSSLNRHALSGSALAGCFYCLEIWIPSSHAIREWIDTEVEEGNATAMCPFCGTDSVLASLHVWPSLEVLREMRNYWFWSENG